MRQVIRQHSEPVLNEKMKQSVVLRLSKNVTNGKRYDVYLVPLPVGIARALNLPVGLAIEISYDPAERNKLILRWENGTAGTETSQPEPSMGVEIQGDREL